jgi:hypothetical protein
MLRLDANQFSARKTRYLQSLFFLQFCDEEAVAVVQVWVKPLALL